MVAGAASAAVSTESQARITADNKLFAQYTVKVDVNGYVSGYGLASTLVGDAPTSAFAVRTDRFYVASPAGPGVAPTMPFYVQTAPTMVNGVSVPVGVYMTDAYIANGTITNAKIANLAVDGAKIARASINTAHINTLNASVIEAGSISTEKLRVGSASVAATSGTIYTSYTFPYPYVAHPDAFYSGPLAVIECTGAPVTIIAELVFWVFTSTAVVSQNTFVSANILMDGVEIYWNNNVQLIAVGNGWWPVTYYAGQKRYSQGTITFPCRHTPPAGMHIYSLRIDAAPDVGWHAFDSIQLNSCIIAQENKV